ncbi:hypothetical protein LX87_04760 [Larkinella arboricola]|uniref:Uncharacterized protein n=1 Tax=Larkinella arboricola TaxID=643671 RepID=A0A327WPU3_LARAB|nr:hypothetical protein LX87_04760 [Larkinella arboricola]
MVRQTGKRFCDLGITTELTPKRIGQLLIHGIQDDQRRKIQMKEINPNDDYDTVKNLFLDNKK